jgi:hypothetical protein
VAPRWLGGGHTTREKIEIIEVSAEKRGVGEFLWPFVDFVVALSGQGRKGRTTKYAKYTNAKLSWALY